MRKTLSKGPDWHSTEHISYANVDGKTGCCVLHESCNPMY